MTPWRSIVVCVATVAVAGGAPADAQTRTRDEWIALARGGFVVPPGQTALGLLREMNALLASPDPVLRDEVAFSAAERWIVRDKVVAPDDLRALTALWSTNLEDGLGATGDDRVFTRTFSVLCLSLIAAREVATPFMTTMEAQQLFDRLLAYFGRERDLRGFDPAHGWMHSVAHTADAFKFLARGTQWASGNLSRLLDAVRAKIDASDHVFVWGENERLAAALHAAVRRADADAALVEAWCAAWVERHTALWAHGPQVNPAQFVRVENAKQVLRALHALLSMDLTPAPPGDAAKRAVLLALARMR